MYVMHSKLTLRMEDAVIRKAKRIAKQKGQSVSRIFSDYIAAETEDVEMEELPPVTASMVGVLSSEVDDSDYKQYLEEKYL
jgi:hypothetical protein